MTIEEGQALSRDTLPAPLAEGASLDHDRLCAQVGWLRAVSRSLVRDPWRAEDVAQETLLAALAAPPRDSGDVRHMRAWLGRVAFNLSRLGARRAARERAREVCVARGESLPGVTEQLELSSTARSVASAVASLPEPHKSVVRLRYFEGLSTAEIAARLGTSELAVRKRLWRARTRLKETLERGQRRDPLWGTLLLGWRPASLKSLAAVAAAVAVTVGGLAWWSPASRALGVRSTEVALGGPAPRTSAGLFSVGASVPGAPSLPGLGAADRPGGRRELRTPEPPRPERRAVPAPPFALAHGVVLDLENRVRPGLEIHARARPDEVLATTDAGGRFELSSSPPLELEARAPGWTTLVPARVAPGFETEPAHIVVAPGADFLAHVQEEGGRALARARLELVCTATTFAALDFAVRLPSRTLRAASCDADGQALLAALPRGTDLSLRIQAEGFEDLEVESATLGHEAWFTLRAERASAVLAGTVLHRDGRPASGARVTLGRAGTITNERGQYRLPLRGVRPEARFEATDPTETSAPFVLRRFGARLGSDEGRTPAAPELPARQAFDCFLGPPLELARGTLLGPGAGGWRVAAYALDEPLLEEDGWAAPAALATSDEGGAFLLALPRGSYDLYALSPAGAQVLERRGLVVGRAWQLEIPPESPLVPARARLVSDDGHLLAQARAEVFARLDGADGLRRLRWRELVSDDQGLLSFARDPALALELVVDHPHARGQFQWSEPGALAQAVLSRRAHLQLRDVPPELVSATLLDEHGDSLTANDGFDDVTEFGFHQGNSPVVEVPPSARWVELHSPALGATRVPIEASPGERIVVRP